MEGKKTYDVWLIGKTINSFEARKKTQEFVSCRDVLKLFFKNHLDCQRRRKYQSAKKVACDVLNYIEKKSNLKTLTVKKIIEKILRLHTQWVRLRQNCSYNGKKEVARRSKFLENMSSEFLVKKDISNTPKKKKPREKRKLFYSTNCEELPAKRVSFKKFYKKNSWNVRKIVTKS